MKNMKTVLTTCAFAAALAISLPATAAADDSRFDQAPPQPNTGVMMPQWHAPVTAPAQQLSPRSQRERYNYRNDYFMPMSPYPDTSPSSGRTNA
ncbi:hypothetical protein [Mycolicibacterium brumae]|uniref:hypothetical protein n=1 Tax=Mycolicibacterium brumae TaxID=85968 RepID=UPI000B136E2F|nr:hypothetical protein [Mycolicibacterium brumae]MCV7192788.1 hypothetical protein [Mycolicibacterium brumae]RWA23377.1 hypothetical protein MBRU_00735 [Mycolicibacterium brumae DSM 44177]UWW08692.1 hypothetical protein L2Z93_001755 [Mycolicibacterium brumae]